MTQTLIAGPEVVARLSARFPALTRVHLQDCLAISETTWTERRDGRPIKRTALERILTRLG